MIELKGYKVNSIQFENKVPNGTQLKLQNQVKYGLRAWKNIILKAGETDISEPLGVEQIQEELPDLRGEPRKQIQSIRLGCSSCR